MTESMFVLNCDQPVLRQCDVTYNAYVVEDSDAYVVEDSHKMDQPIHQAVFVR